MRLPTRAASIHRRVADELAGGTSTVDQVRAKPIAAMDGGDTSMEAMAKKVGMSKYNDLLADVRAEFAKR